MPAARRLTARSQIYQLKVQLRDIRPPVWRRLLVPGAMSLAELSVTLQLAMGWTDCHLHEFEVAGVRYGVPDPDWDDDVIDESRVKLSRVAGPGTRLRYVYDFGDNWQHDIVVEKGTSPQPGARYPSCLGGRRACPPEDVGGPWGYQDFLAAIDDPRHPEYETWTEWAGGSFDPAAFDVAAVNEALGSVAWSRPGRT